MNGQRGDDLEDDFIPDDLVALSEDENDLVHSPDDDIGGLLSADEDGEADTEVMGAGQSTIEKKRKRREKERERKAKKRKLAETVQPMELPSVAAQQPVHLADYLSAMQAKTFSKMSSVELADVQIPAREFHSGHDGLVGIEEFGSAGGIHHRNPSHTSYTFVTKT